VLAKPRQEKRVTNMKWNVFAGLCGLTMLALCAIPAGGQTAEVKEKPPMYSYVADWQIPRARWPEMEKANSADKAILDKAISDGTIVGFGDDESLIHQPDGWTHDNWWSAMSMAGLLKVLDQLSGSGTDGLSVLQSATKHSDSIYISRYYNWRSGSWKGGYTHVSVYKLKSDAPDDAVDTISKQLLVPLMEKQLADGAILEYEVDTEAIHTESPGTFEVVYVSPTADGLDKVNAAIQAVIKAQPLSGAAFGSMVDSSGHRDELSRAKGTYK
jgi:hypothetical protein